MRPLQRPLIRAANKAAARAAETGKPAAVILRPSKGEATASSGAEEGSSTGDKDAPAPGPDSAE